MYNCYVGWLTAGDGSKTAGTGTVKLKTIFLDPMLCVKHIYVAYSFLKHVHRSGIIPGMIDVKPDAYIP